MDDGYFWLTKEQFARLKPHLPRDTRGKPRVDDRRVIRGIVHVLISGCRWKDAPTVYGPRKTLYNRFQRWAAKGVWTSLFYALATAGGPPAEVLIDSSAVKAHRCASGGKRMARPVGKWFWSSGLICLHKRIRPSGKPLAKMESRASWSS
ncbi:transposase [Acidisoma sp. 7E03]